MQRFDIIHLTRVGGELGRERVTIHEEVEPGAFLADKLIAMVRFVGHLEPGDTFTIEEVA
jgi:hypothetical protein